MSEWWGISKQKQLKKFQEQTAYFVNELESILKDFENNGEVKEISSKLKESIKKFQNELS
jgi:hypothetical protein